MQVLHRNISHERIWLAYFTCLCLIICVGYVPSRFQVDFILYTIPLTSSLILLYISQHIANAESRQIIYCIAFLFLGSLSAFRAQIGIDDFVYENIFYGVNRLSLTDYFTSFGVENGYLTVNWLLYHLCDGNYNAAQAIVCFGNFLLWGWAIKNQGVTRYSIPIMVLFIWTHLFFFYLSAGLVRIFIAVPIAFYALHFVWTGNWRKFVFWIIIASTFHLSALMMLLFLAFILKADYFYKHWYVFVTIITGVVFAAFILIAQYLVPIIGDRYSGYSEVGEVDLSIGSFDTAPVWAMAVFYFYSVKNRTDIEEKRYIIGLVLMSLTMVFAVASTMVPLGRLMYYSNLGMLIVTSTIFGNRNSSIIVNGIKIVFIVYALFYVMRTNILNPGQNETLFPYRSFL